MGLFERRDSTKLQAFDPKPDYVYGTLNVTPEAVLLHGDIKFENNNSNIGFWNKAGA